MPKRELPKHADFVKKLVTDPKAPAQTTLLFGYPGESSEPNHLRLYSDPQLSNHVDIPTDAILHTQELTPEQSPLGGAYVWVDPNSQLLVKGGGPSRVKASFLEGGIMSTPAYQPNPYTEIPPCPVFTSPAAGCPTPAHPCLHTPFHGCPPHTPLHGCPVPSPLHLCPTPAHPCAPASPLPVCHITSPEICGAAMPMAATHPICGTTQIGCGGPQTHFVCHLPTPPIVCEGLQTRIICHPPTPPVVCFGQLQTHFVCSGFCPTIPCQFTAACGPGVYGGFPGGI